MLDLFAPQNAQQIVARARVSRQHLIDDDKPPPMVAQQKPANAERKYHDGSRSKMAAKRLQRQADVVEVLRLHAHDSVLTVQQIIYHGGFSAGEPTREAIQKDCDTLYARGILGRQKVTSKGTGKRVWAYWLK